MSRQLCLNVGEPYEFNYLRDTVPVALGHREAQILENRLAVTSRDFDVLSNGQIAEHAWNLKFAADPG